MKNRLLAFVFFVCFGNFLFSQQTCQISQTLLNCGFVNPVNCPIVNQPYIENTCLAGIERILARALDMEYIVETNIPNADTCNQDPANWSFYCPDEYCSAIQMMVDLNASMIVRAAGKWGGSHQIHEGSGYEIVVEQLVCDINRMYDCAGLIRPVIQAGIFEFIDIDENWDDQLIIPVQVINRFANDPEFDSAYYTNNGIPKQDLIFRENRIVNLSIPFLADCPDVSRIEGRMWLYYCARFYIDRGYTALHMGQVRMWGWNDLAEDGAYDITYNLLTMIREYATSIGSFVVMNAENPALGENPNNQTEYNLFFVDPQNPTKRLLLFDFDAHPIRPREITSPPTVDAIFPECSANAYPPDNPFNSAPCMGEEFPAIIDECAVCHWGSGNTSGISPMGCEVENMPYFMYFDFGAGETCSNNIPAGEPGNFENTYGFDDTNWFMQLAPACQAAFLEHYFCAVRQFCGAQAFLQIPGRISAGNPVDECAINIFNNPPEVYRLDHPDNQVVYNLVDDFFNPEPYKPEFSISKTCGDLLYADLYCEGETPVPGERIYCFEKQIAKYEFEVTNPNCISVYSWHVQLSDGSWFPVTYGNKLVIEPYYSFGSDSYTVTLREDNMGFAPDNFGSQSTSIKLNLEAFCCTPLGIEDCRGLWGIWGRGAKDDTLSNTNNSLSVYPNPATDYCFLSGLNFNEPMESSIFLIDILGRVIHANFSKVNQDQIRIDLSDLPSGMYWAVATLGGQNPVYSNKFIVNRNSSLDDRMK